MRVHIFCVASGALLLIAAAGQTQTPPAPDAAANPQAMPGDYFDIPQEAQLKVPLGPPVGRATRAPNRPATATPVAASALGALAAEAAEAAVKSCADDGYIVTVAITDAAGQLKAALAPDGARSNGVYMAMHKAVTVVGFKISTLELRAKIERDPSLMAQVKPNMSLLPGGMPIFKGDRFIGAIATSGASAYVEEKCAAAGIEKVRSRL